MADLSHAARGTSLEMFLKLAEDTGEDADMSKEDDDALKHAEFEDDTGTGEEYVPFGSVYGASNSVIKAVLDSADRAAASAAAGGPTGGGADGEDVDIGAGEAAGVSGPEAFASLQKSNTTSSLFVSSTLSDPDVTEMLNCVSLLLHHQMAEEQMQAPNPDIPAPAYDFSEDDGAPNPDDLPDLDEISSFLTKTFHVAKWSPECHIMALVFVNRLTGYTNIRLHNSNWRPILLCSLLLAQKLWDDKSLANIDFPYIWKKAMPSTSTSKISLSRVNFMEKKFLELLHYNVNVKSGLYAKYYFELRTLREGGSFPLQPLKPNQVRHLESRSAALSTALISLQDKEKALERGSKTISAFRRTG